MNKKELVKYISDKTMITEGDSLIILDVILDGIKQELLNGGKVKLRDFGTFFIQRKEARLAYDPNKQSVIDIPERNYIKFKVSKLLNEKVNL